MDGLKPVPRIRERTMHDGGERISEVALLERLAQRDFLNVLWFGGNQCLAHGTGVNACGQDEQG